MSGRELSLDGLPQTATVLAVKKRVATICDVPRAELALATSAVELADDRYIKGKPGTGSAAAATMSYLAPCPPLTPAALSLSNFSFFSPPPPPPLTSW